MNLSSITRGFKEEEDLSDIKKSDSDGICILCGKRNGKAYEFYIGDYRGTTDYSQSYTLEGKVTKWVEHYTNLRNSRHFICSICLKNKIWQVFFWGKGRVGGRNRAIPVERGGNRIFRLVPMLFIIMMASVIIAFVLIKYFSGGWSLIGILLYIIAFYSFISIITAMVNIFFAKWLEFGNKLAIETEIENKHTENVAKNPRFFTPKEFKKLK
jgi:hypothetical protein